MIILACAGSIPGYWAAVFTVDTIGRKPLQIIGFTLLMALFCVLGFKYHDLSETTLLVLYVISQFLFNAGPNTTTFIVAGECFPTRYRSTAHGISAAMGKAGAILAQVISIPLLQSGSFEGCRGKECSSNLDRLMQLFALFMLLGALCSLLIPEPKGLTLEELSGETRTSYNAGCNGSINLDISKIRKWNPFRGGQPAGFFYPRTQFSNHNSNHRSRAGAMPSPTTGESMRQRRPAFWRQRKRATSSTDGTNAAGTSNQSSRPASTSRTSEQTVDAFGGGGPPISQQSLPIWGAGWGRIDRGKRAPELDEVQLQDVGSLLPGQR
jgi:MFS transporter, PHS family, inorganic phosphate transporter